MAGDYDLSAGAPLDDEEKRQRYLDMLAAKGVDAPGVSRDDAPPVTAEAPAFEYDENVTPPVTGSAPLHVQQPDMLNGPSHQRSAQAIAPAVNFPQGPRPEWKDYAPPVKHGMGRFGQILGEMFTGTPQRAEARAERNYQNAASDYDTEFTQAAASRPKPENEKWKTVPGMVGPKGQLVQEEETTGRIRYAPEIAGMQPVKPANQTPQEQAMAYLITQINPDTGKPYTVVEAFDHTQKEPKEDDKSKDIKDWLEANKLPDTAANREKARAEIAKRNPTAHVSVEGQGGNWMPLYDKEGHVTGAWNPKTGEQKTAANLPGTTSQGMHAQREDEKEVKAETKAVRDLDTSLAIMKSAAAQPTGPNDFAIIMAFVGAVKPENVGKIRWQKAEQDYVEGLRSTYGDVEAWKNRIQSGQRLQPEERENMIKAVQLIRDAKAKEVGGGSGQPETRTYQGHEYVKQPDGSWQLKEGAAR